MDAVHTLRPSLLRTRWGRVVLAGGRGAAAVRAGGTRGGCGRTPRRPVRAPPLGDSRSTSQEYFRWGADLEFRGAQAGQANGLE